MWPFTDSTQVVLTLLEALEKGVLKMSASLDTLTAQVKANTDVEASAVQLLVGLSAEIASLKNDPVAIQSLSDQLKTSADALGAALVANTPAE
jgi:hypothetical protein